jgi:HSP20 family protein
MTTDSPFDEMERAFERMGRKLEQVGRESMTGTVLVDVEERDDAYVVTADLPGFEREEIDARFADSSLELTASREEREESQDDSEEGRYLRKERRRSTVYRSVYLPEAVEPEGTTAVYENGVLTVTLPKAGATESGTDIPVN